MYVLYMYAPYSFKPVQKQHFFFLYSFLLLYSGMSKRKENIKVYAQKFYSPIPQAFQVIHAINRNMGSTLTRIRLFQFLLPVCKLFFVSLDQRNLINALGTEKIQKLFSRIKKNVTLGIIKISYIEKFPHEFFAVVGGNILVNYTEQEFLKYCVEEIYYFIIIIICSRRNYVFYYYYLQQKKFILLL